MIFCDGTSDTESFSLGGTQYFTDRLDPLDHFGGWMQTIQSQRVHRSMLKLLVSTSFVIQTSHIPGTRYADLSLELSCARRATYQNASFEA